MSTADKGEDDLELVVASEYSGLPLPSSCPPLPPKLLRDEKSSTKLFGNSWVKVASLLICSSQRRTTSGDWIALSSKPSFGKMIVVVLISDDGDVFVVAQIVVVTGLDDGIGLDVESGDGSRVICCKIPVK